VADGEGDELHPSPIVPEGRNNEGGVFLGLFLDLDAVAEISI
jgi:hypothetical protein